MIKKFKVKVSNKEYDVEVEELKKPAKDKAIEVVAPDNKKEVKVKKETEVKKAASEISVSKPVKPAKPKKHEVKIETTIGKMDVLAPLPGVIVDILVKKGDKVKENEAVIVLEAMKMENSLPAPIYGIVDQIHVEKGQIVDGNYPLITVVG